MHFMGFQVTYYHAALLQRERERERHLFDITHVCVYNIHTIA